MSPGSARSARNPGRVVTSASPRSTRSPSNPSLLFVSTGLDKFHVRSQLDAPNLGG